MQNVTKQSSLGNHEFDNGVSGLTPFIAQLSCPVLAANLRLAREPALRAEPNLQDSVVFDIDNVKVGVIGYLTPDTQFLAVKNNVEYVSEIDALKEEVAKMQKNGINIIIALGHSGYTKDLEIAREVDGLDLVIGGHTNTFLWNGTVPDSEESQNSYPTFVKQASGKTVPVVQAYAYTKYLGRLRMIFDSNGEATFIDGSPILLDSSVPQDPDVLKIIQKYKGDVLNVADIELGSTSVLLDGQTCKRQECNLGNMITDAMVLQYASNYSGKYWSDASIAIIQGGGIRASIDHATLTHGDLLTVMPFEGDLAVVTINGTILLQMLEHSVANYDSIDDPGEFLQFSGIKVVYSVDRPPGARVDTALVRCGDCEIPKYDAVVEDGFYKVIMPGFVSNGGDGYTMLKGLPKAMLPYSELACTVEYVRRRGRVLPELEGRVTSLGNHEFDEAVDGVIPFIRNLSSPVLAANLRLARVPELRDEPNLHPSVVLARNGVKIGVIGYLTPETKYLAPRNDVEYEDEVVAIRREVAKLQSQNVNILIALGHSGFLKDFQIAKEVEGIDLVIGGHSNTFLWNGNDAHEIPEHPQGPYPTVVEQASGRRVPVVQAYAYTKYLGKLHLIFDESGEIIHVDGQPILLDQKLPRDPDVLDLVNKYRDSIARINEEVIGTSLKLLDGEQCRLRECTMGSIINDAILEYGREHQNEIKTCFNIAIVQGGRIRSSIEHPQKPFNVTRGDLLTVLPFTDTMSIVQIRGSVLLQALEHAADTWRRLDSTGQFLQFSGMQIVYDLSKPPGARIISAKAAGSECGDTQLLDIQNDAEYKVIMPSFISDGGDGYDLFRGLPTEPVTFNEVACVIEYFKKHSPIDPKLSKRLVVLNEARVYGQDPILTSAGSVNTFLNFYIILLSFALLSIALNR